MTVIAQLYAPNPASVTYTYVGATAFTITLTGTSHATYQMDAPSGSPTSLSSITFTSGGQQATWTSFPNSPGPSPLYSVIFQIIGNQATVTAYYQDGTSNSDNMPFTTPTRARSSDAPCPSE
jgi:hypothetical protein